MGELPKLEILTNKIERVYESIVILNDTQQWQEIYLNYTYDISDLISLKFTILEVYPGISNNVIINDINWKYKKIETNSAEPETR